MIVEETGDVRLWDGNDSVSTIGMLTELFVMILYGSIKIA